MATPVLALPYGRVKVRQTRHSSELKEWPERRMGRSTFSEQRRQSLGQLAPGQSADQEALVAAGLAADQLDLRAAQTQQLAQRLRERLVGPAVLRRGRHRHLERAAVLAQ